MKLGNVRIIIYNSDGEEISRQIYDFSKSKGTQHWQSLWRWALHQGHSLQVTPIKEPIHATLVSEPTFTSRLVRAGALLSEPHRR